MHMRQKNGASQRDNERSVVLEYVKAEEKGKNYR